MALAKSGITGQAQGTPPEAWQMMLTKVFGTGLGTGYFPTAQGTFGSALFVMLWAWLAPRSKSWQLLLVVLINLVSIPLSDWGERLWGPDPGRITIDEFAGQAVTLLAIPRINLFWCIVAFMLFRFFDVFKLPFLRDHVEPLPDGFGVTLDDTIAGGWLLL